MTPSPPKTAPEGNPGRLRASLDYTLADMPDNWEATTAHQLKWLSENGSYMQRKIAGRYIRGDR